MSSSVPNSSNVNNEPVAAPVDHHNQVINMDAFYAEHSSTFIPVHLVRSPAGLATRYFVFVCPDGEVLSDEALDAGDFRAANYPFGNNPGWHETTSGMPLSLRRVFPNHHQQFWHTADIRDLYGTNSDPDVWPTDQPSDEDDDEDDDSDDEEEDDEYDDSDDDEPSDVMSICSCSVCEEVWDLSMFNVDEIMYDGFAYEFLDGELPAAVIPCDGISGLGWLD